MATTKISIDVLLMIFDSAKPYVQLPANFRDDPASEESIISTLNQTRDSLEAGRRDIIYGVSWQTTKVGEVGVVWIELTNATPETLDDCQAWLDQIGLDWANTQPGWAKQKNSSRKGYTGFSIQKK